MWCSPKEWHKCSHKIAYLMRMSGGRLECSRAGIQDGFTMRFIAQNCTSCSSGSHLLILYLVFIFISNLRNKMLGRKEFSTSQL
ncbi:hypothetical protein Tsubulata_028808 [Turnera subulata]|uniref:Uncharacterized protein n=1 Tax=Turnera subulata TaxID=218843 RepID=A0A9Q0J278_9ROSI|nr:hypothetical protein Tsubulata_028808 [Turnera subulata]